MTVREKYYALAIGAFLGIPVVTMLGMPLTIFINPEIAAGHANYSRNFWLLMQLKHAILLLTLLAMLCLWFLTCYFVVKAKQRSIFWSSLAIFGPFGLIVIAALKRSNQASASSYQNFVERMWIPVRVIYEIVFFLVVWEIAYDVVAIKRDFIILHQSVLRGISIEKIVEEQQASGGMWAFSEGLESMFLMVLLYLLWPLCFNVVAWLIKTRVQSLRVD